jgi:intracellular multiplication protein IcmP
MATPNSGRRTSWASQDDYAGFNFIVIVVGIGVFSYLLWTYYHAAISAGVMWLMHQEIRFISLFSDHYRVADHEMAESNPACVTLKDLYGIAHAVGTFFQIPVTGIIIVLAIICAVRASPSRFKRQFDLDGLINELSKSFPVISAFAKRHLQLREPMVEDKILPADYALTPPEWIAHYASDSLGRLSEPSAKVALAAQLGQRWTCPEEVAPAARLLFVVFTLHLAERRSEALRLLGDAAASVANAKEDGENGPATSLKLGSNLMKPIDLLLHKKLRDAVWGPAIEIASRHAYVTTALMALLTAARIKAGVLAPAQFVWLKLVDRNLWYALHSLGYEIKGVGRYVHPNPRIEALGARNHWAAERIAGRPIVRPVLDEALATLRRFQQALGEPEEV